MASLASLLLPLAMNFIKINLLIAYQITRDKTWVTIVWASE